MAVYRPDWIQLGGLELGSRGIDLHDYDDLIGDTPKRGSNRIVAGEPGSLTRVRVPGDMRAALAVRLRGDWTVGNVAVAGAARIGQLYSHLAALRAVTAAVEPVDLTIYLAPGRTLGPVDCIIEDGGRLSRENEYVGVVVLSLLLPDGPIPLGGA